MSNLKLTRQEYKGKIYVKNIRKNLFMIRMKKKSFRIHNTAAHFCPSWPKISKIQFSRNLINLI